MNYGSLVINLLTAEEALERKGVQDVTRYLIPIILNGKQIEARFKTLAFFALQILLYKISKLERDECIAHYVCLPEYMWQLNLLLKGRQLNLESSATDFNMSILHDMLEKESFWKKDGLKITI